MIVTIAGRPGVVIIGPIQVSSSATLWSVYSENIRTIVDPLCLMLGCRIQGLIEPDVLINNGFGTVGSLCWGYLGLLI